MTATAAQDDLVTVSTLMNVCDLPQPISVHVTPCRRPCDLPSVVVHVRASDAQAWRGAVDGAIPWTRRRTLSGGYVFRSVGSWRGLPIAVSFVVAPARRSEVGA